MALGISFGWGMVMSEARKKLLEKIRAMMNTSGRTEEEMMAFLAKAREMMATYEISEAELDAADQEKATIYRAAQSDPYEIKWFLAKFVGKFTRCRAWAGNDKIVCFAGLESDVIFATWLLDTLQRFVMRALRDYQKERSLKKMTNSNYTSASFVMGCTSRISQKLNELCPKEITENALVTAELARNGIVLAKRRADNREAHAGSVKAGVEAGNSARFDRPVGEGGGVRRLK